MEGERHPVDRAKILHEEIFFNSGPVPLHKDGKPDLTKIIPEVLAILDNPHS